MVFLMFCNESYTAQKHVLQPNIYCKERKWEMGNGTG